MPSWSFRRGGGGGRLYWNENTSAATGKAKQWLYLLRRLMRVKLPQQLLITFYTCTTESILIACMTALYGSCTKGDTNILQHAVKAVQTKTKSFAS